MARYRFALLGDPVDHSRSPELHHAMFELAGLEGEYLKIRADEGVLQDAVEDLRSGGWDGLNVTMPLKAEAARVADSLSPMAARSGSVNTLVRSHTGVTGHSTDSSTFHRLVTSDRFRPASSILVLGSGGTAAAAAAALGQVNGVYVAARRMSHAEDLAARLGGDVVSWGAAVAGALVINTTPLGMAGERLPEGVIDVASGLIDLPYGPDPTPAVVAAGELGIPHSDGHEFLLLQAMASFALWTGSDVGLDALTNALKNA